MAGVETSVAGASLVTAVEADSEHASFLTLSNSFRSSNFKSILVGFLRFMSGIEEQVEVQCKNSKV